MRAGPLICLLACLPASVLAIGTAVAGDDPLVTNRTMPALTRLLEDQPLHPLAKELRPLMARWETDSKDVDVLVCPGVLAPLPDQGIKYRDELFAQFVFGSAAYQLDHPSDRGKRMPSQLAGMYSLLRAYQAFLSADPAARVPRFDALSEARSRGTLEQVLAPLVEQACG